MRKEHDRLKRKKCLQVMTISILLIVMKIGTITANSVYSPYETLLTLNIRNKTLKEVFQEIESKSEYIFLYNDKAVNVNKRVDISIEGGTIKQVLDKILDSKTTKYRIDNRQVIVYSANSADANAGINNENTAAQGGAQSAHTIITGKIVDTSKEPLIGATVLKKGTKEGVATSIDGDFQILVKAGEPLPVLVVTYLGYKKKEVKVTKNEPLTIVLEEDATVLDEFVVVAGIFNKAKESYTGAAVKISSEELQAAGNHSVLTSIRNIDPSFNIVDNINIGSDPNKLPTITVRGSSSLPIDVRDVQSTNEYLREANQPLIIKDGFEINLKDLKDMDENQIENITLLKDANATALYGSRGSNGVVVITTKVPKSGRLQLTYKGSLDIEAPDLTSYNLMNAREKLMFEKASGLYETEDARNHQDLQNLYNRRKLDVERGVDTYWLKYPVRTGIGSKHSLGIEGSENSFRYAANLSYNNVTGTMKGSERNTLNGNMLFMYKVNKLTFKNNLEITHNKAAESPYGKFSDYGKLNSYWTPYDLEGNLQKELENYFYPSINRFSKVLNPLYNAFLPSNYTNGYLAVRNGFAVEWNVTPTLFFRGQFGITLEKNQADSYTCADHTSFDNYVGEDFARRGKYTLTTGNSSKYDGRLTLDYSKTFNEKHQVFAGFGGEIYEKIGETYVVTGEGFSILDMKFLGMALQYEKGRKPVGKESITRTAGVLMNTSYTYDRRYFVDFSGKYEGSSLFGANRRYAPNWSTGVGWNLYNESFLKDNAIIDVARFRLSYGITGNQQFPSFLAFTMYSNIFDPYDLGGFAYENWYGVALQGTGNKDLGWEQTYQYNLGTEWSLFNSRWRFNVDLYNKLTKDVIASVNLPYAGGFKNYSANIGEIENKGVEATTTVFILQDKRAGLSWSLTGSLAHNKNTLKKISNALEELNNSLLSQDSSINPSFLLQEGQSQNTIFAVPSKGIDPSNGREIYIKADGSETYTWDGKDQVPCGAKDPKISGIINTAVRYKGINLGVYFFYRWGGYDYNHSLASKVENINPYDNADRRALYDRWKEPGDIAFFKSVKDLTLTNATSRFVMKDNTFVFQTINLGYDFPAQWVKKHFQMEYLSIKGYLEDIMYLSTIKRERGLDYPFSRKFSVSLTARF